MNRFVLSIAFDSAMFSAGPIAPSDLNLPAHTIQAEASAIAHTYINAQSTEGPPVPHWFADLVSAADRAIDEILRRCSTPEECSEALRARIAQNHEAIERWLQNQQLRSA